MRSLLRVLALGRAAVIYGLRPALLPASRRELTGPVRLRKALEELGGTWVKLGQTLALRFDLLPRAYCYELFGLLNQVAPFPYAEVERILRDEFGRGPEEVFASFEREPFGAASIGQVHGAVLHSGEQVAVKAQRPGAEALFATDISLMYRVAGLIDATHAFGATRTRDVIDEFARWTKDELDYRVEARHAVTMSANARDRTEKNPEVHLEYTTRRVLTAERLDGLLLVDVLGELRRDRAACLRRLGEAGYDLDEAASNIVWNFLNQVYAVGVFHGDLHPANLMVLPGNRIGYVDFGIVGHLPEPVRKSLVRYAGSLFSGHLHDAISEFLRWVKPSPATKVSAATDDIVRLTQEFFTDLERPSARKRELIAQYQIDLLSATREHRMTIDPVLVLYMKVVLTIDSVTSELSPALDLQSLHVRFVRELVLEGIERA